MHRVGSVRAHIRVDRAFTEDTTHLSLLSYSWASYTTMEAEGPLAHSSITVSTAAELPPRHTR